MVLLSLLQLRLSRRPALRRRLVVCASAAMLVLRHFDPRVYGLAVAIGSARRLRSIGLLCEQQLRFVLRLISIVLSDIFILDD